jgi:dienelactone hydrolase
MEVNEISIPVGRINLKANLHIPSGSNSLVIFSHGRGSSRFSPRNNFVADMLNKEKISTLLIDLLTEKEDKIFKNRFDIDLLSERLIEVTSYMMQLPRMEKMELGYFGASTGAASALNAAAYFSYKIKAVVSRGGRPDLAPASLKKVEAPTLLIVGGYDNNVIRLNEEAFNQLKCEKGLEIINGATHLFEEPGAIEEVSKLAMNWLKMYLLNPIIKSHAF